MICAALARLAPDRLRATRSNARSRRFAGATMKVRGEPGEELSERQRRAEIASATEPIDVLEAGGGRGSLRLRLITERCPLFHVRDERELPFPAPWWAFLWPGGLGLTRFLLEDSRAVPLLRGKSVLEVGSGCGSASIAAAALGARKVVANDICPYAGSALALNVELNEGPGRLLAGVPRDTVSFVQENKIGAGKDFFHLFDVVLVGDMLYV
jgi:predicted nicotinamide N-methyase